jgi:hypothetical protein
MPYGGYGIITLYYLKLYGSYMVRLMPYGGNGILIFILPEALPKLYGTPDALRRLYGIATYS